MERGRERGCVGVLVLERKEEVERSQGETHRERGREVVCTTALHV